MGLTFKARQMPLFRHDVLRPGSRGGTSVLTTHRKPVLAAPLRTPPGQTRPYPDFPFVIANGLGVDSTAVLVELVKRGIRPQAILFADTGGEKPETYDFLPIMQHYLVSHGFPEITVVRYTPERAHYDTLEGNMLVNETVPSPAVHTGSSCSMKWKQKAQDRWVDSWQVAQAAWASGKRVLKMIGYDDDLRDLSRARRACTYQARKDDGKYAYWYPLQEWGITREGAKQIIRDAGLPVPPKSACFFCPASQTSEILDLAAQHPDLAARAVAMEDRARSGKHPLRVPHGLGLSAKQTWRSLVAHLPAVRAELEKIPPEKRFGSAIVFDHQATAPGMDTHGAYRVDVDTITPELLHDIQEVARLHGRIYLGPGHLTDANAIFRRYEEIAAGIKHKRRLYVQIPGGDTQSATLEVIRHYGQRIKALANKGNGVRALVPVLPGPRPLSAAYLATVAAIGNRDFAALVPGTASVDQLRDLAAQEPGGIHLAGARPHTVVDAIRAVSPPVNITADQFVAKSRLYGWAA